MRKNKLHARQEYTQSMLPQNRKEVFFDVVRLHWRKLFMLGLLVLLFSAPLHLLQWLQDGHAMQLQELSEELSGEQLQEALYELATANNIRVFAGIPFWALLGLGLAGLCRVIRQYAWEENVHVYTDFIKGIRENGKHTALLGLLVGSVYAVCVGTYSMLPYGPEYLSWVSLFQVGISLVLVLPVCGLCLTMIPVYAHPLKQHILLSFAVYLKTPVKTLAAALLGMLLFVPAFIPVTLAHILGSFLISFLAPFVLLAWTLYSYEVFDEHINSRHYPELVGRGVLGKHMTQEDGRSAGTGMTD